MCVWGVEREGSAWRNYESRRASKAHAEQKKALQLFIHTLLLLSVARGVDMTNNSQGKTASNKFIFG